jgi:hypothetical protein
MKVCLVVLTLGVAIRSIQPSCCSFTATAGSQPGELNLTVTNIQESPVTIFQTTPEFDFKTQIMAADGNVPELTDEEKRRINDGINGSRLMRALKKGDSLSQVFDVRKRYVLRPGKYSVTIFRYPRIQGQEIELQTHADINIP